MGIKVPRYASKGAIRRKNETKEECMEYLKAENFTLMVEIQALRNLDHEITDLKKAFADSTKGEDDAIIPQNVDFLA